MHGSEGVGTASTGLDKHIPTTPNAAVKIRFNHFSEKDEKGPTQPSRVAATRSLGQVASTA